MAETIKLPSEDQPELAETLSALPRASDSSGEASPMPVGSLRYQRGKELGRGGMGRVVEALDQQFGRTVALKEMLSQRSPKQRLRFQTEALVTGSLEHPGIVSVYERGESADGELFYAMRLVRGRTLAEALKESKALPSRLSLVQSFLQVTQAMGYAHSRGVIHRDLKPANLILGAYGEAVVIDWGLAKIRGVPEGELPELAPLGSSPELTAQGSVLGTPAYMAPEQARGEISQLDERTDVFALGAILYHLLSGQAPYRAASAMATVQLAAEATPTPLSQLEPKAPVALRLICERAMSQDPAARYPNALAMAEAVEAALSNALLQQAPTSVRWAINGVIGLSVGVALLAVLFIWLYLPTFQSLGPGPSIGILFWSSLSLALFLIEWRTSGRYHLSSLGSMLNFATGISGVIGVAGGLQRSFENVSDEGVPIRFLFAGISECLAGVAGTGIMVVLQVFLWSVLRRHLSSNEPPS